jgi:hypothetical protein
LIFNAKLYRTPVSVVEIVGSTAGLAGMLNRPKEAAGTAGEPPTDLNDVIVVEGTSMNASRRAVVSATRLLVLPGQIDFQVQPVPERGASTISFALVG